MRPQPRWVIVGSLLMLGGLCLAAVAFAHDRMLLLPPAAALLIAAIALMVMTDRR